MNIYTVLFYNSFGVVIDAFETRSFLSAFERYFFARFFGRLNLSRWSLVKLNDSDYFKDFKTAKLEIFKGGVK
tara:strand:+ start:494 stop:712 length:219 start_codon:yes stop_codon:yes gene_type:complete